MRGNRHIPKRPTKRQFRAAVAWLAPSKTKGENDDLGPADSAVAGDRDRDSLFDPLVTTDRTGE